MASLLHGLSALNVNDVTLCGPIGGAGNATTARRSPCYRWEIPTRSAENGIPWDSDVWRTVYLSKKPKTTLGIHFISIYHNDFEVLVGFVVVFWSWLFVGIFFFCLVFTHSLFFERKIEIFSPLEITRPNPALIVKLSSNLQRNSTHFSASPITLLKLAVAQKYIHNTSGDLF